MTNVNAVKKTIRIGSRESALAMAQSNRVAQWLRDNKGLHVEVIGFTTKGDQVLDRKLDKVGGKGLFIKELEVALLNNEIDIAVHSAKDMPAIITDGLGIIAVSDREDPRDALLTHYGKTWQDLPVGAVVGTSSARRESQLLALRPDLKIRMLRGNINTRIAKWKAKEYDAIVLAAAGLHRLSFENEICSYFEVSEMLPAVGQGILAIEGRTDFDASIFEGFHDNFAFACLLAERSVLQALNADCSVPLGAHATVSKNNELQIKGFLAQNNQQTYHAMTINVIDSELLLQKKNDSQNILSMQEKVLQQLGDQMASTLQSRTEVSAGIVHLVGSGPGDPGLLTLRAVEKLQIADAVVYDKLAGWSFLAHTKPGVQLFDVGKQSARHTLPQDQINQLLVDLAKKGLIVVRLKGGDPYVFGRGGEEAEVLVSAQIPFTVTPGISSSVAVPGAAGIPVTHRDHCTSFHVITGHERPDREDSAIDFQSLANLSGTLVFLMGISNLQNISSSLIQAGKAASTPVAIIEKGSTPNQRLITGTLETIFKIAEEQQVQAPAVTVIGTVVNLASILNLQLKQPYTQSPLQSKRILVGRTRRQASRLTRMLQEKGAIAIEIPLLRIESNTFDGTENFLKKLQSPHIQLEGQQNWLIFTSENGVEAFFAALQKQRIDMRKLYAYKIAAVGPATRLALENKGLIVDVQPNVYTVDALTQELLPLVQKGDQIFLARSNIANPIISQLLHSAGCEVFEWSAYNTYSTVEQPQLLQELIVNGEIDWVPFSSSSMVNAFMTAFPEQNSQWGSVRFASIGPVTSATMRKFGIPIHAEAKQANIDGLCAAMMEAK